MLKKILIGIGVVIVLLVAAAVIVPFFIPVETYKAEIARQVKAATGRDLAINGKVSFSIIPTLGLEANDLVFSNAPGAAEKNMVTLKSLVVELKLWPLLSGNVEVDRFLLVRPVINLEVAKDGRPNWQFGSGTGAPQKAAAEKKPATESDGSARGFALRDLKLGKVGLDDGTVTYRDRRTGEAIKLSKINMDVTLPGIAQPMDAKGRATWNGEEVALRMHLETPRTLIDGQKTAVAVTVDSKPVSLAFNGKVTKGATLTGGGAVDLNVPSVRKLAAWAGKPIDMPGSGFGPLKIKGDIAIAGSRYSFNKAQIDFDEIHGKGDVSFDGSRKVPYVKASLQVDKLDANPYLPPEKAASAPAAGTGGSSAAKGGKAAGAQTEWSNAPIDAKPLRSIDADLAFTSGPILIRKIRIDKGTLTVALHGGRMKADLTQLALYGGQGQGTVILDGSGSTLGIEEQMSLSGIKARPLLTDAAGMSWLEGGGNMTMKVAGRGNSQRQIVSNLNGNGNFKFTDGAIYGINIAEIVRRIGSGDIVGAFNLSKMGESQKTDFSELGGTFTVQNGVVHNSDLLMQSPLLRMTGKGQSSLPAKTIDYRVEPKVVATLKGQGGQKDLKGLTVPFLLSGPWSNIRITPDLAGMLKSKPEETIKGIIKGIPQPGTSGGTGSTGTQTQPTNPIGDMLKKLVPQQ